MYFKTDIIGTNIEKKKFKINLLLINERLMGWCEKSETLSFRQKLTPATHTQGESPYPSKYQFIINPIGFRWIFIQLRLELAVYTGYKINY